MKAIIRTYISYITFTLCAIFLWHTDIYAQSPIPETETAIENDSNVVKARYDSTLAGDSILSERNRKFEELQTPIVSDSLVQKTDSTQESKVKLRTQFMPNPQKALWYAILFPGAGQIYNRKYWKLPIVYGGFVGCAYALTWNSKMYKDYSMAYQDIMSDNPNNDSYLDFLGPGATPEKVKERLDYYKNLFKSRKDIYRRQRDLSIIAFVGVYVLSIIDAYVDAELSTFDISKDLSMKVEPTTFNQKEHKDYSEGVGLKCSLKF